MENAAHGEAKRWEAAAAALYKFHCVKSMEIARQMALAVLQTMKEENHGKR